MPKVAIVMGSKSDLDVVKPAMSALEKFGIESAVRVISAHRTPMEAHDFASKAKAGGIEVIIAAAGKAAHLAGVLASYTTLPVIGIPVFGAAAAGLDSLLSMVQMPAGVPVATVAINGAENAAILAAQILALKYPKIDKKLAEHKAEMERKVIEDDKSVN